MKSNIAINMYASKNLWMLVTALSCLAFFTPKISSAGDDSSNPKGPLKEDPAFVDLDSRFDPSKIQATVNLNLPEFVLKNILSEFDGGKDDPFQELGINVADLTRDIRLIRVLVVEKSNSQADAAYLNSLVKNLRKDLDSSWMTLLSVPEGNVAIYAKGDQSGARMRGISLLVNEGDAFVFLNVVGELPIGKILKAASKLSGDSEQKANAMEALKNLMGSAIPNSPSSSTTSEEDDDSSGSTENN